jgi:hypothetical protein
MKAPKDLTAYLSQNGYGLTLALAAVWISPCLRTPTETKRTPSLLRATPFALRANPIELRVYSGPLLPHSD